MIPVTPCFLDDGSSLGPSSLSLRWASALVSPDIDSRSMLDIGWFSPDGWLRSEDLLAERAQNMNAHS